MSEVETDDDHLNDGEVYVDFWDVMQYSTDHKGKRNHMKIGRAWAKADSNVIALKLYAAPFTNVPGAALLKLIPFYPEQKKQFK